MNEKASIQKNENNQHDCDGCDAVLELADETLDEDLPAADGGVGEHGIFINVVT
jgi:hypothetical protein